MKALVILSIVTLAACSSAQPEGKTATDKATEQTQDATPTETVAESTTISSEADVTASQKRAEDIRAEAAVIMAELAELKKQEAAAQGGFSLVDLAAIQDKIADLQAKLLDLAAEAQVLAADLQAAAVDLAADLQQAVMDLITDLQDAAMDIVAAAQAGDVAGVQQAIDDLIANLPVGNLPAGLPGLPQQP